MSERLCDLHLLVLFPQHHLGLYMRFCSSRHQCVLHMCFLQEMAGSRCPAWSSCTKSSFVQISVPSQPPWLSIPLPYLGKTSLAFGQLWVKLNQEVQGVLQNRTSQMMVLKEIRCADIMSSHFWGPSISKDLRLFTPGQEQTHVLPQDALRITWKYLILQGKS